MRTTAVTSALSLCLATACAATPGDADMDSREPVRGVARQAVSTCPVSPSTPLTGIIDDFDDRDLELPLDSGLHGTWSATTDSGSQLTPTTEPDPEDPESQALHLGRSGPGFAGAYIEVSLADGCPVNARRYTGIRLKARLSGSFRLNLPTLATERTQNHLGMAVRGMATRSAEYEIPFNRLSQLEVGTTSEFKPAELLGVELWAEAGQPYEFWLDEIGFAVLDECGGSVAFEDELIDDYEDGDLVNRATPRGRTVAYRAAALNAEKSLCPDCLSVEPDPDGTQGLVARVAGAETFELVMGSLAAGCRGADARDYDGVELEVRAAEQFTVVLASLDGVSTTQSFVGKGQWRTVRVPFGPDLDRSRLDFLDIVQPMDLPLVREDMRVGDVKFYSGEAVFGARCESDAECAVMCWGASSGATGLGGPARGVCSRPCSAPEDCTDIEAGTTCAAELGYCVETCDPTAPAGVELSPDKCHGRPDVVCAQPDGAPGADGEAGAPGADGEAGAPGLEPTRLCQPRCSADTQCGGKLYCNRTTGLCQEARPTGLAQGMACDPEDLHPATPCAGYCDPASSTCRRLCVLAAPNGCASGSEQDSVDLACLPLFGSSVPGNEGMCAVPCDCSDECGQGEVCAAVTLAVPLAHSGVCASDRSQAPTLAKCPNGCASGAVRACHGERGCLGSQHCEDDGSGYGACTCRDAAETGGTSGEAGAPAEDLEPSGNGGEAGEVNAGAGGRPVAKSETVRSLGPGCGCSVPKHSGTGGWSALFLLLGFSVRRRLRIRRRGPNQALPISSSSIRCEPAGAFFRQR